MKISALESYRCPYSGAKLTLQGNAAGSADIMHGTLSTDGGLAFSVTNGAVDFIASDRLNEKDAHARQSYDVLAGEIYDNSLEWMWTAFGVDEAEVRTQMVDALTLAPGQTVLEIGCGSGRDSKLIAERLQSGSLYLQDLSRRMVEICQGNLKSFESDRLQIEYAQATANHLPFRDALFDRVFHFGAVSDFSDIGATFAEIARVVKPGGKIVIGDESLAPWLRHTEFGRVVTNNNKLFEADLPLRHLPANARDVSVHYIIKNTFYFIAFVVGDGPPQVDFDHPHKGWRGGTMRTRYFGQLEGVSLEAKALALQAAKASGKSMHAWLDDLVREGAQRDIKK